jgi:hypothetical protein
MFSLKQLSRTGATIFPLLCQLIDGTIIMLDKQCSLLGKLRSFKTASYIAGVKRKKGCGGYVFRSLQVG